MENMENVAVIGEVADVASVGTGCSSTAVKVGIATIVTGGIALLVYAGVKKIKSVVAAKKAANADEAIVECEE